MRDNLPHSAATSGATTGEFALLHMARNRKSPVGARKIQYNWCAMQFHAIRTYFVFLQAKRKKSVCNIFDSAGYFSIMVV
ncbi:hypothetical protein [Desulfovibrio intestinalis]|uniref:Uncharacterized protein n=1 Tax=Desulfovibrio intestinalis TaxID=58621 RepID=A0A7W8FDE8_9BACT|nr:hypothetical protein [Desulfovibrio intestinalis]MBB5142639.1 hypothetical protein [Desulfovibrio intestinalis]